MPNEGHLTEMAEGQTAKVPSMVFLGASNCIQRHIPCPKMCRQKAYSTFYWTVSCTVVIAWDNKIVKTEGHN